MLGYFSRERRLARAFARRGPWITRFEIAGHPYGGHFDSTADPRPEAFFRHFPEARRILELGSQEGGHTHKLASRPGVSRVVALEGRAASAERARFVMRCLGLGNVEVHVADLETAELARYGRFDAVFCSGVLYHVPEPWKLLEQIASVAPGLFLWTHYAADDRADTEAGGYRGLTWREGGLADPLSGLSATSFWPVLDDLLTMVRRSGLSDVEVLETQPDQQDGPSIFLVARSTAPV